MKLHTDTHKNEVIHSSNSSAETKEFTITASSKAFGILSSNIYSNKIRAIIREISCNAVDAHIASGNKDKFDIYLPSQLNPQFKCRDYGTGMSHEDVMELYTTYFGSTKQNSNMFIGALGLGSKSPFSYTNSFTVISYFNGIMRSYLAFIKGGTPNIKLLFEQETKEPNGIEVVVPVKQEDANSGRWIREAEFVFATFELVEPNFPGLTESDISIEKVRLAETGFYAPTKSLKRFEDRSVYFVMGGVSYKVDLSILDQDIVKNSYTLEAFNKNSIFATIPIGAADIEPGREGLSYDEETIKNCSNIIKQFDENLSNFINPNLYEFENPVYLGEYVSELADKLIGTRLKYGQFTDQMKAIKHLGMSLHDAYMYHSHKHSAIIKYETRHGKIQCLRIFNGMTNPSIATKSLSTIGNGNDSIPYSALYKTKNKKIMILDIRDDAKFAPVVRYIKAARNYWEFKNPGKNFNDEFDYVLIKPNSKDVGSETHILFNDVYNRLSPIIEEHMFEVSNSAEFLETFYDPKKDEYEKSQSTREQTKSKTPTVIETSFTIHKALNGFLEVRESVNKTHHHSRAELREYVQQLIDNPDDTYIIGSYRNTPVDFNCWDYREDFSDSVSVKRIIEVLHSLENFKEGYTVRIARVTSSNIPVIAERRSEINDAGLNLYNEINKKLVRIADNIADDYISTPATNPADPATMAYNLYYTVGGIKYDEISSEQFTRHTAIEKNRQLWASRVSYNQLYEAENERGVDFGNDPRMVYMMLSSDSFCWDSMTNAINMPLTVQALFGKPLGRILKTSAKESKDFNSLESALTTMGYNMFYSHKAAVLDRMGITDIIGKVRSVSKPKQIGKEIIDKITEANPMINILLHGLGFYSRNAINVTEAGKLLDALSVPGLSGDAYIANMIEQTMIEFDI